MKHGVREYIKLAFKNKKYIEQSEYCGCYHCCTIFNNEQAEYITEKDGEKTATCPFCNIDSVIDDKRISEMGESLDINLLQEINKEAF